jgi:hypothetical protein
MATDCDRATSITVFQVWCKGISGLVQLTRTPLSPIITDRSNIETHSSPCALRLTSSKRSIWRNRGAPDCVMGIAALTTTRAAQ